MTSEDAVPAPNRVSEGTTLTVSAVVTNYVPGMPSTLTSSIESPINGPN